MVDIQTGLVLTAFHYWIRYLILQVPYELVGQGLLYKIFMNIRTIWHFFQVIDSNPEQISHFASTIWVGRSRVTVKNFYEHNNNLAFFSKYLILIGKLLRKWMSQNEIPVYKVMQIVDQLGLFWIFTWLVLVSWTLTEPAMICFPSTPSAPFGKQWAAERMVFSSKMVPPQ